MAKVVAPPIFARDADLPDLMRLRRALVDTVRKTNFPALVETRPKAQLILKPGDACSSANGNIGTIGGFLKDLNTGMKYAATCGHVMNSGSVSVGGTSIGTCTHAYAPQHLTSSQVCAPSGANVNHLDIALIDVSSASVANSLKNIASQVFPGEHISVTGGHVGQEFL